MAKDRVYEFSAPGRVEIGGNHTDHQHGRVLAAAIDLTTNASVCKNDDEVIRVFSQSYDPVEVYIHDLELHEAEKNTTVRPRAGRFCGLCAARLPHRRL